MPDPEDVELQKVIVLIQETYPNVVDYNVWWDNRVSLLDVNDKVVDTITCDELTRYWNRVEGCMSLPVKDLQRNQ